MKPMETIDKEPNDVIIITTAVFKVKLKTSYFRELFV